MHIARYIDAVRQDLERIAAVGDASTVRAAELLTLALDASLGQRLQELLGEAALELSAQLPDAHVEVRVAGRDPELVLVEDPPSGGHPDASDELFTARITLRLPDTLKSRLESAASNGGQSLNAWIVQTLGRALEGRSYPAGGARRLTGYGQG